MYLQLLIYYEVLVKYKGIILLNIYLHNFLKKLNKI